MIARTPPRTARARAAAQASQWGGVAVEGEHPGVQHRVGVQVGRVRAERLGVPPGDVPPPRREEAVLEAAAAVEFGGDGEAAGPGPAGEQVDGGPVEDEGVGVEPEVDVGPGEVVAEERAGEQAAGPTRGPVATGEVVVPAGGGDGVGPGVDPGPLGRGEAEVEDGEPGVPAGGVGADGLDRPAEEVEEGGVPAGHDAQ